MKNLILFSAVLGGVTLAGCSSAYRTAQTPDDVYFSEGPVMVQPVSRNTQMEPKQNDGYTSYWERQDDNMLRMKVSDRDRWSQVDDIDYWNGFNNNNWVNFNTGFNSPWAMNTWHNPWMWNQGMGMGWNRGWGMGMGWNSGWGMGWNMGWNSGWGMGMGWNSWNNNWNNPWCWNRPVTVINKFPLSSPSRGASALRPYTNNTYTRGGDNTNKNMRYVNPGTSRSIWETNSGNQSTGRSLYRDVNRSSGSGSSYDRPARTFDGGGSSGGGRTFGGGSGGSSGGSSGGGSSRGGRGG